MLSFITSEFTFLLTALPIPNVELNDAVSPVASELISKTGTWSSLPRPHFIRERDWQDATLLKIGPSFFLVSEADGPKRVSA